MISFDQVLLLQEKVESAVQKIVELKAENDALRSKCSELTNALSEKTELLETLTTDEQKIESTILGALNKLNAIEDSIVKQATNSSALQSNNSLENKADDLPTPPNNTSEENNDLQFDEEDSTDEKKFDIF